MKATFTKEEAQEIASKSEKSGKYFYFNVFGFDTYYTLFPTIATPTGKAKGFPKKVFFKK